MRLDNVLKEHAFVQGLTDAQILRLASTAAEVTFDEDEIILVEGQRSTFFYMIVAGSVAVELHTPGFDVCVQALGPHQVFGWSALLEDQDTLFRVRARERTTAVRLSGANLAEACRADPELGAEILRRALRVVAGRVKATEVKFAEMCGVRI
jgi:CRP/FNR family cyclic AMP-dependent transcriptional regulator